MQSGISIVQHERNTIKTPTAMHAFHHTARQHAFRAHITAEWLDF